MTAEVDVAARRAFVLCENIVKKIAPGLGVDLEDLPDGTSFAEAVRLRRGGGNGNGNASGHESNGNGNGNGNGNVSGSGNGHDSGSGMEAFEELVDFEGGVL
jgi:hypothetical protein